MPEHFLHMMDGPPRLQPTASGFMPEVVEVEVNRPQPFARDRRHTTEGEQNDGEITPRSLRECEAEAVALLCCAALDLPGVDCCLGYIQSWYGVGNPIPERSAQRILKAADQILKAGTTSSEVAA